MVREFACSADAVDAVCGTLETHCPNDVVEVVETYHQRAAARPQKVAVRELRPVLFKLCGPFPRAFVRVNEHDANGEIGLIWCHCAENERNNCGERGRCEGAPNSPRVTIILDKHEGHPVWIGMRKPPTDNSA